jgi:V-type H+-transporting ATPase subunit a
MGVLRSEAMKHGTLVLPVDRARSFIDLIGANTSMQFEDMNARDMHRPYKKHIQRIDEMERIIRFLFDELTRLPGSEVMKNNVQSFLDNSHEYSLDSMEGQLKKLYGDFVQFKENNMKLAERRNASLEERYVMQTAIASLGQRGTSLHSQRGRDDDFDFSASRGLLDYEDGGHRTLETMFSNVAGVIPQADQDRLARTLFRATRGNTFTHFQQIPEEMQDRETGKMVRKSVFVIYFQDHVRGSSSSAMSEKIKKICGSFGIHTYRWPQSREAGEERRRALSVEVEENDRLLRAHEAYVGAEASAMLQQARQGGNSVIEEWRLFCMKEKSIYATLNLFEGNMNLRASCWYPATDEDQIRTMLIRQSSIQGGHSSAMLVSDRAMPQRAPPTYIRRNEFTAVFQDLVDTYGLPRYGEANPMLLTTVTFPFLFGIMYGDIGHGALLFAFGLWCVFNAQSIRYSLPELYTARHMITMMGFFSVYAGFIYNDFFSIGLNLFGSRWKPGVPDGTGVTFEATYDITNSGGAGPYPFGVDPAWHGSQNELLFMNSLKMKISVIFGVAQMVAGLFLRFSNAYSEHNLLDFCCECVPMMVFMLCFFGFMDVMIVTKWVTPMDNPPSIINSLIAMAMWQDDTAAMFGMNIVRLLMILTMLTVPVMLIPKPLILYLRHKAEFQQHQGHMSLADDESMCQTGEAVHDTFDVSEMVIHQVIETIEYVLGTVSHTASYLRLWALSLAHQQLSLVFFQKFMLAQMSLSFPVNILGIFIGFGGWFGATCFVLLGMDVMECTMHTLRLHWVEFQSKFFKADGYAFIPYRHLTILEENDS